MHENRYTDEPKDLQSNSQQHKERIRRLFFNYVTQCKGPLGSYNNDTLIEEKFGQVIL